MDFFLDYHDKFVAKNFVASISLKVFGSSLFGIFFAVGSELFVKTLKCALSVLQS